MGHIALHKIDTHKKKWRFIMNGKSKLVLMLMIAISVTSPCYSFTVLGWSENGEIFAFAHNNLGFEADEGEFIIVVEDIVTDTILFSDKKTWSLSWMYGNDVDTSVETDRVYWESDAWKGRLHGGCTSGNDKLVIFKYFFPVIL